MPTIIDRPISPAAEQLLNILHNVHDGKKRPIQLHEPHLGEREWEYVKKCLDSGWVSYLGQYVEQFEKMLSDYTSVEHVLSVVNGTAALHLGLMAAGVRRQDEVLVPAMTFVATANAVAYLDAVPHFTDINAETLGVCPQKLNAYLEQTCEMRNGECINKKTGRRISALIAVHALGHPVDLDALNAVCRKYGIMLIEDAAEALGTLYKGTHVGGRGHLAVLSFNGNKIITTGGGGALLTNDGALFEKARHLATTAKVPHPWKMDHDQVGYNYRLPNINAALGCAQMERIHDFIRRKRALAQKYAIAFKDAPGARFQHEPRHSTSNYWLNALVLNPETLMEKEALISAGHDCGIKLRPSWRLLHRLPMFSHCPKMELATAEHIEAALITLPSSVFL